MLGSQSRKNGSGNGNGNGNGKSNGHYRNGNDHLIELHDVVKAYRSAAGEFTALKGIDLEVDRGEFVAVIGKSGSGKSTLVNMITGIDRPTSGEILVGDTAIQTLKEGKLAEWRGRNIGVIFQFFQLLPTLTVAENVMLPMDFCHMYSMRERRERAMHLLEQVGVADQADKLPSTLSGGQQQRVAIARALANDPPILAADEPTGNLDSKTAESVFGLFETLVAQGKTILMVTHDRDLARRATRTVILSDGEVIEEYLAKTFPTLTEAQLIEATRNLEPQKHAPGAVILQQGATPEKFLPHHARPGGGHPARNGWARDRRDDHGPRPILRRSRVAAGRPQHRHHPRRPGDGRRGGCARPVDFRAPGRRVGDGPGSHRPHSRGASGRKRSRPRRKGEWPCLAHAGARSCAISGEISCAPSWWCSPSPSASSRSA